MANAINFLKSNAGDWFSSRADKGGIFTDHFQNLLSSSNPFIEEEMLDLFSPVISDEDNLSLCSIPTELEVFQALTSLGSTKAPGPDGFTALFYKKYWYLVKVEVLNCIWNFFNNNSLLRNLNHTFLALIPKSSGSHATNQFRPISLCNIVYKIISKILANRLKPLLTKFISPLQSAFVPNRNIQDNTILAQELLHTFKLKRGKGGFMFLKLDMENAFDRMEWKFILAILGKLGFSQIWINWIRICITFTSFSFLLNGSPFGCISPERGLRQGDPISPFLFIIGTEVLSRLLFQVEKEGAIKGLKISKHCSPIHHLLFADDLLIFGKATLIEASNIYSCLDKYCKWSGQSINVSKSTIRFTKNLLPSSVSSITNIFPFQTNSSKSIYLGLPFFMKNSKREAFKYILEKVISRVDGWRAKHLSQAGRLVLIKSVAASLPSYAMSSFLVPASLCSQLDRCFKNFFWGFPKDKTRNMTLKAWDSICLPKHQGGLRIKKMRDVNLSLITKLGWKLLNNADSMWVGQLRGKYLHSSFFLSP